MLSGIRHVAARPVLVEQYQTDMAAFHAENPQFSVGLLTFVLEYVLANKWPENKLMGDYNKCDETCTRGQTEPCGCTCTTDPMEWEDDAVSTKTVVKINSGRRFFGKQAGVLVRLGWV